MISAMWLSNIVRRTRIRWSKNHPWYSASYDEIRSGFKLCEPCPTFVVENPKIVVVVRTSALVSNNVGGR